MGEGVGRAMVQPSRKSRRDGAAAFLVVACAVSVITLLLLGFRPDGGAVTDAAPILSTIRLVAAMTLVGALLVAAVRLSRRMDELRRAASTDPLTGLLNRAEVTAELGAMLRGARARHLASVMILDLDGFKEINDRYGHSVGDHVLITVAERLVLATNGIFSIGRLGGDEFIILATAVRRPPHFPGTWAAVMHHVSKPITIGSDELVLGVSAGVSLQLSTQQKSPEQMLHEADVALYTAKDAGGGQVVNYQSHMQLQSARESERRSELEGAIANDEFEMHFQPEIDLRTGELIGAESLLRWNHPSLGVVAADAFIEDLERLDLLGDLLPLLFRQATSFAQHYQDSGFTIRLNLAAEQLSDPRVVPFMQDAIDETPGVGYCLEVTERSVLDASVETIGALRKLRELGVVVALDDFGTGYSSLKQLHDLPVDAIKIDRMFVKDLHECMPDESIAAVIIDLGSLMDLEIIAEGIETPEQHRALAALGCTRGQGYLIGRPVARDRFLLGWPRSGAVSSRTDRPVVDVGSASAVARR